MNLQHTGMGTPSLPGWSKAYAGKVRDVYSPMPGNPMAGQDVFLVVASNRITAFDHVLPAFVPEKGKILSQLSRWWFDKTNDVAENHMLDEPVPAEVAENGAIVRALHMLPYEFIVRGYITERAQREIQSTGNLGGTEFPKDIRVGDELAAPHITASVKAAPGKRDATISWEQFRENVGNFTADGVKEIALALYERGHAISRDRGLVMADAKFEFGMDQDAGSTDLVFADEAFTPDAARYWLARDYAKRNTVDAHGKPFHLSSYDKEVVGSWLTSPESGWELGSGRQPGPLPAHVVENTRNRYVRVYQMLTGQRWD